MGDRDADIVQRKGEEVARECVRVLTTSAGRLTPEFEGKQYPLPDFMPR